MRDIFSVVELLKEHEGFEGYPYEDTEGFLTVGFGTKLPLTKREASTLLYMRLEDKINELQRKKPLFNQMPERVQVILANMAYQLGVNGLLKFKRMWSYLEKHDFYNASLEGLDSRWARQTPKRAIELMKELSVIESN